MYRYRFCPESLTLEIRVCRGTLIHSTNATSGFRSTVSLPPRFPFATMATQMSKKRKVSPNFLNDRLHNSWVLIYVMFFVFLQFVADGVFFAELNEVLTRELAEDGYSGVEVRVTPMRTEIIIRATRTQAVLGACFHRLIFEFSHFRGN